LTYSDGPCLLAEIQRPRLATLDDVDSLVQFGYLFVAASPYKDVGLDEDAVRGVITHLITNESGVIFISDGGFIAGALTPLFFQPSVIIAAELAWYAPGAGGTKLREVFEDWARDNNAAATQMNTLNNEFAASLSSNLVENGYTPVEVSYIKAL